MKGSKEISAGGRKTVSVAIIADGNLPGARAICTSYCLATGSQILKITNKGSSHSFFSCSGSKSRELPLIVPLMPWLEVRFETSMKSSSRPGWLQQQICETVTNLLCSDFFISTLSAGLTLCSCSLLLITCPVVPTDLYCWMEYNFAMVTPPLSQDAVLRRNSPTPGAAVKWCPGNHYRGHGPIMDYTALGSPPTQSCQKCPPSVSFWGDCLPGQILELWEVVTYICLFYFKTGENTT